jgi:NAD(P)-dependent dehydrogenase (short-subunit alcohol dehydrogenase family)
VTLAGRVAVVTGAAGGIGGAIVQALLARGARVHGLDRLPCGRFLEAPSSMPGRFSGHCVDLADPTACKRMLEELRAALPGRCDILINNAALSECASFQNSSDALLQTLFEVNIAAAFRLTRELLPALRASGHAAVVNIASELALVGQAGYSAYCATKGALLAWSRALAVELAPEGIRVNVVCPGPVDTAMLQREFASTSDPAATRAAELAAVPLGRLGSAADIAAVVSFLAADEARFVTGAVWPVDGGKTAQ